jgi:hypothetical protein
MKRLGEGRIQAFGQPAQGGERVEIGAVKWIDLRIMMSAQRDEVRNANGSYAYHDTRIAAAQMRELWFSEPRSYPAKPPEPDVATEQESGNGPASVEASATDSASARQAAERACQQELERLMRAAPDAPIAKAELRLSFPGVSDRAFDRAFTQAAVNTKSPEWTKAGRRKKKET